MVGPFSQILSPMLHKISWFSKAADSIPPISTFFTVKVPFPCIKVLITLWRPIPATAQPHVKLPRRRLANAKEVEKRYEKLGIPANKMGSIISTNFEGSSNNPSSAECALPTDDKKEKGNMSIEETWKVFSSTYIWNPLQKQLGHKLAYTRPALLSRLSTTEPRDFTKPFVTCSTFVICSIWAFTTVIVDIPTSLNNIYVCNMLVQREGICVY